MGYVNKQDRPKALSVWRLHSILKGWLTPSSCPNLSYQFIKPRQSPTSLAFCVHWNFLWNCAFSKLWNTCSVFGKLAYIEFSHLLSLMHLFKFSWSCLISLPSLELLLGTQDILINWWSYISFPIIAIRKAVLRKILHLCGIWTFILTYYPSTFSGK